MRISSALAGAALAALITVGLAEAAHGDVVTPDEPASAAPLTILLMGDSYTAGNGARDAAGERSYYGPAKCMRSRDTWGEQYADFLGTQGYAVTLLNRACSAATTHNMLNDRYLKRTERLVYPEPELAEQPRTNEFYAGWAASQPVCAPSPNSEEYINTSVTRGSAVNGERAVTVNCARWLRPQVEALNPDVDLIFFTVGGNDAHFPDIMRQCLVLGSATGCKTAIDEAEQYVTDDFANDLTQVLDQMHARTDGNAKVVYLGYPRLEASTDLVLTSFDGGKVVQLPVAAELDRLIDLGAQAQRIAVDEANAKYGPGYVTYLDQMRELFAGHEPDARPGMSNPDRWIAEAFETTVKDEWYHFRPEGQSAIAEYVASYGTFGAAGGEPARDLAIVTDGSPAAIAAIAHTATRDVVEGARVTIVEQKPGELGGFRQRVVAANLDAPGVRAWANATREGDGAWVPAAQVALPARWNAVQQVMFVGDASVGTGHLTTMWHGEDQGLNVVPQLAVIDTGETPLAHDGGYTWAQGSPHDAVATAFATFADTPHAWAGGRYSTVASGLVSLDASGSFVAAGSSDAAGLSYEWDLDRDGVFEFAANGARTQADARLVSPGWVSLRVTSAGGVAAVSNAWVDPGINTLVDLSAACAGEAGDGPGRANAVGGSVASTTRGGGDACQPLGAGARWTDDATTSGTEVQPVAAADAEHNELLAWIADPQLFTEDRQLRSLAISMRDGRSGTRASAASRRRPRELVQREQGLQVLLDAGSRELVAA